MLTFIEAIGSGKHNSKINLQHVAVLEPRLNAQGELCQWTAFSVAGENGVRDLLGYIHDWQLPEDLSPTTLVPNQSGVMLQFFYTDDGFDECVPIVAWCISHQGTVMPVTLEVMNLDGDHWCYVYPEAQGRSHRYVFPEHCAFPTLEEARTEMYTTRKAQRQNRERLGLTDESTPSSPAAPQAGQESPPGGAGQGEG